MKTKESEFLQQIEKHRGIIHKLSKMYMDQLEDQQDLFQEIVLQLWKSYGQFRGESQFSTWMYRVGLNTALVYYKKERKRAVYPLPEGMEIADEAPPEGDSQLELFYKAVHELNQIERALIFLLLEGQSHKEMASSLGISEVNVRVKLSRTREKLQQVIKSKGYGL